MAKPEEKLAGIRFDPELLTPSRLDYATSLVLQHMKSGVRQELQLPENSEGIRYIRFNPVKSSFVFASKVKDEARLELYQCELTSTGAAATTGDGNNNNNDGHDDESKQTWTMTKIDLNRKMNFVQGCAYQFSIDGSKLFINVVPSDTPSTPPKEPVSTGPAIQQVERGARKAPGRTYQDLLKNEYDEAKLKYYCTTEVLCLDTTTKSSSLEEPTLIPQSKGGHLLQSLNSSPCGRYLLAQLTTKFSYSVPISRFGTDVVLWDLESNQQLMVRSIPVNDEIPLSFDACSRHPRGYRFHPCGGTTGEEDGGTTIMFVQATDGGDPANDPVDGERDALYCQKIDTESFTLQEPTKFVGLEWRYSDLDFCESGMGILEEYRWKDRMERKWILNADGSKERMLWERSWEDRYTSPGEPLTRRGAKGQYFIVQPTPTSIYLKGAGASPLGDRPFLDVLDFGSEEVKTTRLWRCTAPVEGDLDASKEVNGVLPTDRKDIYESLVCVLPDNDSIMISRESKTTPRNYYLSKLADGGAEIQVTNFEHPQPDLLGVTKELVQYKRDDGVELTANLYLPANYDGTPLPTLFWAYPREFKDSKAAGQVKGSKHNFVSAHWASPIHWAAKGWCIFDDFALPVIGEGDAQPNDTFIEQIVAGATAAVEYAVSRGVCDENRCAVGGHSYGSFMTAHLLSHTSLFSAGIGRSGAFNRTLTPMSFQSEDRSIWEARDTYITMSPLMHVKKMSEQERVGKMLLIHGEADENSGTHPMQSERYFAALKAFGIESRLVMLPHERHSYRARESILHMAYEQEEWLKSLEEK
jgi:dienelactone hydrolase